ncbi:phosphoadenosine phosphosulfate sulfurtransferase [Dellaglioa algida]|nr:phosphoadenosine phosphosulfate sulfurtransferase [Dellaglioa algida]
MSSKKYLDINVYDAAQERINYLFEEFDDVYISFSGGKDSGTVFNLLVDKARKLNKKFSVLYVDMEGMYKNTVDYVEEMIDDNMDVLNDIHWVCLPFYGDNSSSSIEPIWNFWDPKKNDLWIREMPDKPYVINVDNYNSIFGELNLDKRFGQFVEWYGKWRFNKYGNSVNVMGIRAQESLNRWRAVTSKKVNRYKGHNWTVANKGSVTNAYPIYDWLAEDDWIYFAKFNKKYNKAYDLFYRAGVPLSAMRIDEPFGVEELNGIKLWKVMEPETWGKMVNRVKGVNLANLGYGTQAMGNLNKMKLPPNHTWKSYLEFLLETLPKSTRDMYLKKFKRFEYYWKNEGSVLNDKEIEKLKIKQPEFYNFTGNKQRRGDKTKQKIIALTTPDDNPDGVKSLSYKRMVIAILKGDIFGKTLSFGPTKRQVEERNRLIKKYNEIL